jgi:dienelactone hydrolase
LNTSPTPKIPPVRIGRILLILGVIGILLILGLPFGIGFGFLFGLTHFPCQPDTNPGDRGLPYEDVTFPSSEFDARYAAYYIPGGSDRTMIIVPTLGAGRGDSIDAIQVYHERGYNVLTYRARVCFGVTHSLGYVEVTAVGDALDYLRGRGDIDMVNIGLHGFSAGGATVLMALARYPEIRTAIAHGGYEDFERLLDAEATQLGSLDWLFSAGARLAYRMATGLDIGVLKPIDGVVASAPRPILLVYGSREASLIAARAMQDAALGRVALWIVPGAEHGNYIAVAGADAYGDVLVGFLERVFSAPAPAL